MDRKILENRLIDFSTNVTKLCRNCDFDALTMHLSKQIVRSSSSAALNYGESQSAESRADFSHKLSIVLKELRETHITLILIEQQVNCREKEHLTELKRESNELVSIFQKSLSTLQTQRGEKRK